MELRNKTVSFITLGCKVNQYETDGMCHLLEQEGCIFVPEQEKADIAIVNTCAVTNIASRKSRQMLHRVKKKNPDAILIAAGCYIQNVEQVLRELPEVDIFLGNNQKRHIAEFLKLYQKRQDRQAHKIDINHTSEYEEFSCIGSSGHTRAFVKIQDGCNQFCSYCIIPYVRGRVRSRKPSDICAEAETLAARGYRELVLTGIHISSYGSDFETKCSLLTLLGKLHEIEGIERIRLGSLEPGIITEEFVKKVSDMPKVCPHFHLSLQSGCDATLKRMNRHYTTKQYKERCDLLRTYYSYPALTTDIIVGFPGETIREFEQTEKFLKELQFYEIHVFPYSIREGTNAAKLPEQVDGVEKKKRSEWLLALTKEQKKKFEQQFIGRKEQVLLEEQVMIEGHCYLIGHTMHYVKLAVLSENGRDDIGSVRGVIIKKRLNEEYLLADFS